MKPGQTISPASKDEAPPKAEQKEPVKPKTDQSSSADVNQEATWDYEADDSGEQSSEERYVQPVSWTATEYAAHEKNAGWFLMVLLGIAVVTGLVYLITRDVVSSVVFVIIGIAFTAFAGRPPQTLEYSLDATGIHIASRSYPYSRFRSFAILADEPIPTIMLIPTRRFDLPINIHFDAADGDKIVNLLGSYLPGEERNAPPVDRFMSKIRF